MALYNFKKRFAAAVESGAKLQTIRRTRKHPPKVGDLLYLYTGLRGKYSRRLMVGRCTKIDPIVLVRLKDSQRATVVVTIWGKKLSDPELEELAIADGFPTWAEMRAYFLGQLPFYGEIVHWVPESIDGDDGPPAPGADEMVINIAFTDGVWRPLPAELVCTDVSTPSTKPKRARNKR